MILAHMAVMEMKVLHGRAVDQGDMEEPTLILGIIQQIKPQEICTMPFTGVLLSSPIQLMVVLLVVLSEKTQIIVPIISWNLQALFLLQDLLA